MNGHIYKKRKQQGWMHAYVLQISMNKLDQCQNEYTVSFQRKRKHKATMPLQVDNNSGHKLLIIIEY